MAMTPARPDSTSSPPQGRQTEVRSETGDTTVWRVDGRLTVGEMSQQEAERYLALRRAANAGDPDAQLILRLMRVRDALAHNPALQAQLQQTIDMLQTRIQLPR
jgi:hypothetical protein